MNETETVSVADGYYKCRPTFVGPKFVTDGGEKRESAHKILRIGLQPISSDRSGEKCPENAQVYWADLPLLYSAGEAWKFYDKIQGKFVERKPTTADSSDAIAHARKCVPEWDDFIENRAASHKEAFDWWYGEEFKGCVLVCKLKTREYEWNGTRGVSYDATIIEARPKAVTASEWSAGEEKLARSIFKVGGKKPQAAKSPAPAPEAPAEKLPPVEDLKKTAWQFYTMNAKDDREGAKYYARVAEAIGNTTAEDWETWSAEDWKKAVQRFAAM